MVIQQDKSKIFAESATPLILATNVCDTNAVVRSVCGKLTFLFSAAVICHLLWHIMNACVCMSYVLYWWV